MASPSNNRNRNARPTGGRGGGRAGKPDKPVAGTKDRTVRVPTSWNAQVVDPTNNRGAGQRPTGGQVGGRAGRPGGSIARPSGRPLMAADGRPEGTAKPPTPAAKPPTAAAAGGALRGMSTAARLGAASTALGIPFQVANVVGGFQKLANHPFLKGKGGENGAGTTSANSNGPRRAGQNSSNVQYPQGTPSGSGSRRGAAPVAGGGRTGRGGTTADAKPTRQGPPVPERLRNAPTPPVLPAAVTRDSVRSSTTSSAPSRGGSTPRRSGTTSPARSSTPTAPAKPGQKFADFNPGRGTSKTNNPLMKDMIGRMKDREDKAQASAASKLTNNFGKDSGYQPKEKVDGSGVDTKKKMTSTSNEYNSKKRRYGG